MSANVLDSHVLVLNRVFQVLQVTNVRHCFSLFYKGAAKAVTPDYMTIEWKDWCDIPVQPNDEVVMTPRRPIRIPRVIVLTHYDRTPKREVRFSRFSIYARDGSRCQYCGRKFQLSELSLDHVIPQSRGGESSWDNVVAACVRCNVRKADRTPEEAGMLLRVAPKKPHWSPVGRELHPTWKNFLDKAYWNVELNQK